jgi:hypothetical protein
MAPREDLLDQGDVADPARGVQRRAVVDAGRGGVEPESQHQLGRLEPFVKNGHGQVPVFAAGQRLEERRGLREDRRCAPARRPRARR